VTWNSGVVNNSAINISVCLRRWGDDFCEHFPTEVSTMVSDIDEVPCELKDFYRNTMDVLFAEGISWERILTSFIFTSELAYQFADKTRDISMVGALRDLLVEYSNERFFKLDSGQRWLGGSDSARSEAARVPFS